MEHVVFSAAEDGVGEEFRRVSSLEEAVRVVEHLRNDLGIAEASVFALTPVPLAFKAYYRVELPGPKDDAVEPVEATPASEAAADYAADPLEFGSVSALPVPLLAPAAPALPASRSESEGEHSLGYFAR